MRKNIMLNDWIAEQNGVLKISDAKRLNLSTVYLFDFIAKNNFEKVSKGIYVHPDVWTDDMYLMQLRYKQVIFSHETALYLLDMSEREPINYTVTVKAHYNTKSLKEQSVNVYSVKKELYTMGLIDVKTSMGNNVRCYNEERTVCDMVRSRKKVDIQETTSALKKYAMRKDKNIPQLMRYARELKIEKNIRQYLEVLL
ncbi:MAG: abortive phage infection protein [bacterium]|nr:abortive phage infection protein [bacterium]